MKIYTQKKTEKGFTLVETLVAITILLLVIIGPLTVAQKGIQNAYYANEQVTAVFLAQEAIEAVREFRDTNALEEYQGWASSILGVRDTWKWYINDIHSHCKNGTVGAYGIDGTGCAYDTQNNDFETCASNNGCVLKIDNGVYQYGSGVHSPFMRKVYIKEISAGVVAVTVDVSWESQIFGGATTRTVKLQTWIYDHYQRFEEN